jgi:hypothetical protein
VALTEPESVIDAVPYVIEGVAFNPVNTGVGLVSPATFKIPVVAAKYVLSVCVAEERVDPHVPPIFFNPPNVRLPALMVSPFPIFAKAPVTTEKFPATEMVAELIDFAPLPAKTRLL